MGGWTALIFADLILSTKGLEFISIKGVMSISGWLDFDLFYKGMI